MFSIILYILLPVAFAIHEFEEQFMRRRWERTHYDNVISKFPKMKPFLSALRRVTPLENAIVELEQFMFLSMAVALGVYADPVPMCALFWGFCLHLALHHIVLSIYFRCYFPGLFTSILFMPYFILGVMDLSTQFSIGENVIMAVSGVIVTFLNFVLMQWLMKKFRDL